MATTFVLLTLGLFVWILTGAISVWEEKKEDAIEILQKRYSKGEISVGEYVEMKEILNLSRRG